MNMTEPLVSENRHTTMCVSSDSVPERETSGRLICASDIPAHSLAS